MKRFDTIDRDEPIHRYLFRYWEKLYRPLYGSPRVISGFLNSEIELRRTHLNHRLGDDTGTEAIFKMDKILHFDPIEECILFTVVDTDKLLQWRLST